MTSPTTSAKLVALQNSSTAISWLDRSPLAREELFRLTEVQRQLIVHLQKLHSSPPIPTRILHRLTSQKHTKAYISATKLPLLSTSDGSESPLAADEEARLPSENNNSWTISTRNSDSTAGLDILDNDQNKTLSASGNGNNTWDTVIDDPNDPNWTDGQHLQEGVKLKSVLLVLRAAARKALQNFINPRKPVQKIEFDFPHLPRELRIYMLKFMLVSPSGITNPWWHSRFICYPGDPDVKYTWNKYFRPSILATCRDLCLLGTPILYEQNKFRFTRLVSSIPDLKNDISLMERFLSHIHITLDGKWVRRGQLIKEVTLQDTDAPPDGYHLLGASDYNPDDHECWGTETIWLFAVLRRMEWAGMRLRKLTITIDEKAPKIKELLDHEKTMRALSTPGDGSLIQTNAEQEARKEAWEALRPGVPELWPYSLYDHFWSAEGLLVHCLYIQGIDPDLNPLRTCFLNGRVKATNPFVEDVKSWIESTGIQPLNTKFLKGVIAPRAGTETQTVLHTAVNPPRRRRGFLGAIVRYCRVIKHSFMSMKGFW